MARKGSTARKAKTKATHVEKTQSSEQNTISTTRKRKRKESSDVEVSESKFNKSDKSLNVETTSAESSTSADKNSFYKISSWNVNGVRAWLDKKGLDFIKQENPDIFCIQETKCSDDKFPENVKNIKGYKTFPLSGDKDGYSGVCVFSKKQPVSVKYGIGIDKHDKEGRVITAEYDEFFLVAAYVPNAGKKLVRLDYRQDWDKDFCKYLKTLDAVKPVILCGDLNVAHQEIDLANPKTNKKNAGFTQEERDGFSSLLNEGFIDSFRTLYPDAKGAYTFWTYMMNARAKNVGWRLDYFVLSSRLRSKLCDSIINKDVLGSDHCPITLTIAF
ncbi:DNA repair nuclease APEX1-like [Tachypleus tridentatus]|uniref:DNA repair nuclease APEX1-like n=1 Tax=Tachypleus tridentatus TaxID=6853 RepID=UPI003FD378D2